MIRRVFESGEAGYTLYDPITDQYNRQDQATHDLCELLDGKRTPDEVLEAIGKKYPQYDFTHQYLEESLDALRQMGHLEDAFRRNVMVQERAKAARKRLLSAESFKNILFIQAGTVDPTPIFDRIYPVVRVMFTRWWVIGTALASALAAWILWDRRDIVVGNLGNIFTL